MSEYIQDAANDLSPQRLRSLITATLEDYVIEGDGYRLTLCKSKDPLLLPSGGRELQDGAFVVRIAADRTRAEAGSGGYQHTHIWVAYTVTVRVQAQKPRNLDVLDTNLHAIEQGLIERLYTSLYENEYVQDLSWMRSDAPEGVDSNYYEQAVTFRVTGHRRPTSG